MSLTHQTYSLVQSETIRRINVLKATGKEPTSIGMPDEAWNDISEFILKTDTIVKDKTGTPDSRSWLGLPVFKCDELEVFGCKQT